jgi:hypothetical protein
MPVSLRLRLPALRAAVPAACRAVTLILLAATNQNVKSRSARLSAVRSDPVGR